MDTAVVAEHRRRANEVFTDHDFEAPIKDTGEWVDVGPHRMVATVYLEEHGDQPSRLVSFEVTFEKHSALIVDVRVTGAG